MGEVGAVLLALLTAAMGYYLGRNDGERKAWREYLKIIRREKMSPIDTRGTDHEQFVVSHGRCTGNH